MSERVCVRMREREREKMGGRGVTQKRFHCFSIIADLNDTVMKKMAFPNDRSKCKNKGRGELINCLTFTEAPCNTAVGCPLLVEYSKCLQ